MSLAQSGRQLRFANPVPRSNFRYTKNVSTRHARSAPSSAISRNPGYTRTIILRSSNHQKGLRIIPFRSVFLLPPPSGRGSVHFASLHSHNHTILIPSSNSGVFYSLLSLRKLRSIHFIKTATIAFPQKNSTSLPPMPLRAKRSNPLITVIAGLPRNPLILLMLLNSL